MSPLLKGGVSVDNYGSVGPTIDGENNPTQGTWNNQDAVLTGYSGLNGTPNYNIKGPNGVLTGMITHTLDGPPPYLRNQQPSYAPYPLQAAYNPPLQGNVTNDVYAPTNVAAPIIPPTFNFLGGGPQALPTAGASYAGPSFAPLHGPQAAAPPGAIAPSNFNPGMPGGSGGGGRPTMPMPGPMPTGGGQSPTPVQTGGGQPLAFPQPFMQPSGPPVGNYGSPMAGNGVMPAVQPGQQLKGPNPLQQAVLNTLGLAGKGANAIAGAIGLNQPSGASLANGLQPAPPPGTPTLGPDGRPQAPERVGALSQKPVASTPQAPIADSAQQLLQDLMTNSANWQKDFKVGYKLAGSGARNKWMPYIEGLRAKREDWDRPEGADPQTGKMNVAPDGTPMPIIDPATGHKTPGGLNVVKTQLMNKLAGEIEVLDGSRKTADEIDQEAETTANDRYNKLYGGANKAAYNTKLTPEAITELLKEDAKNEIIAREAANSAAVMAHSEARQKPIKEVLDRIDKEQMANMKEWHDSVVQMNKDVLDAKQKYLDQAQLIIKQYDNELGERKILLQGEVQKASNAALWAYHNSNIELSKQMQSANIAHMFNMEGNKAKEDEFKRIEAERKHEGDVVKDKQVAEAEATKRFPKAAAKAQEEAKRLFNEGQKLKQQAASRK